MARVTGSPALRLREMAREAVYSAGGRGFVRFLPEGGALLVTDAPRRTAAEAICAALEAAGFACGEESGGLLAFSPSDALIARMTEGEAMAVAVCWDSPLHPAQALAARFLMRERAAMTEGGRRLVIESLRVCHLPPQQFVEGTRALRARAAQMLREGDTGGMAEAGWLLAMHLASIAQ